VLVGEKADNLVGGGPRLAPIDLVQQGADLGEGEFLCHQVRITVGRPPVHHDEVPRHRVPVLYEGRSEPFAVVIVAYDDLPMRVGGPTEDPVCLVEDGPGHHTLEWPLDEQEVRVVPVTELLVEERGSLLEGLDARTEPFEESPLEGKESGEVVHRPEPTGVQSSHQSE
jgi:hypothetical protein